MTPQIFKTIGRTLSVHSPEILMGVGASGFVGAVISSARATPKAMKAIKRAEYAKGEDLTLWEKVKAGWSFYIPTGLMTVSGLSGFFGAYGILNQQSALLASTAAMTQSTLQEYQQAVRDTIGEEQEKQIRAKLHEKKLDRNNGKSSDVIVVNRGRMLHEFDGVFFYATERDITRAESRLNRRMYKGLEMFLSMNDIRDELGLPLDEKKGERLGLTIDDGIEFEETAYINDNGEPYIQVWFPEGCEPHKNYASCIQ